MGSRNDGFQVQEGSGQVRQTQTLNAEIADATLNGVDDNTRGFRSTVDIELNGNDGKDLYGAVTGSYSQGMEGGIKTEISTTIAFNEKADLGQCIPAEVNVNPNGSLDVSVSKPYSEQQIEDAGCVTDNRVTATPTAQIQF